MFLFLSFRTLIGFPSVLRQFEHLVLYGLNLCFKTVFLGLGQEAVFLVLFPRLQHKVIQGSKSLFHRWRFHPTRPSDHPTPEVRNDSPVVEPFWPDAEA